MRFALSVLVFLLLAYVAAAQVQPQYVVYRSSPQAPYYEETVADVGIRPADPRLFLPTTTTTTTSTSLVICTKFASIGCNKELQILHDERQGKQFFSVPNPSEGRGILFDGEGEEQFPIAPTAVEGVKPTQLSSRDARVAEPQLFIMSSPFAYHHPESGLQSGSFNYHPVVLPFYGSNDQPVGAQRLFFTQIQSLLTVTKTVTAFTVSTSTSTPVCSKAGTIAQCPSA